MRGLRRLAAITLLVPAVTSCAGSTSSPATPQTTEVTVFAASSLTEAFNEIEDLYEQLNPGTVVTVNFLSSSDLATQLEQGAPAHVFASADETNMQRVVDAHLADGDPEVVAHNELEIVVPAGNPGRVAGLKDLENEDLVLALCTPECPAGRYAHEVIERAGLQVEPDSLEPEVKSVVTRVELGEADAGIVFATDVIAAGPAVTGVEIPEAGNVTATYLIATLRGAPEEAREFVRLVLSAQGGRALERHGFGGR